MRLAPWIPPLLWTGFIFWFSTGAFGTEETGRWILPLLRALLPWADAGQLEFSHWLGRKIGHLAEYAILAWLWYRAFARSGRGNRPGAAFGVALGYAIADELHQGWIGERTGSALDVVLDAIGAGTALALTHWGWRRTADWLTGALLWVASGGGTLLLLVSLAAAVPPGWLWGSVPLAWIALWWRRRRRRRRPTGLRDCKT